MRQRLERALVDALAAYCPWTNVYGLSRSILAFSTAATLAANEPNILFRPAAGTSLPPFCDGARHAAVFCLVARPELNVVRWLCVAALLVVASGWRPRFTGIIHWWVSVSLQATAVVVEGGDQVAAILSMLLIPITLTDGRHWHWSPRACAPLTDREASRRVWAASGHLLIRLQVAGIYFHAALGKLTVREWKDGTAMYYWGTHESFGAPDWLRPLLKPVFTTGWSVASLTWAIILLEICLSFAFLMKKAYQRTLIYPAILLHVGIIFVHSLPSFGLIMIAALILYLHPLGAELQWVSALTRWLARSTVDRAQPQPVLERGRAAEG